VIPAVSNLLFLSCCSCMFFTDINNDIHVWNVHKAIWNFHFKTQIQEHCTTAVDRLPTNGLLFMKSYNARVPNANPPTIFPVWITLRAFVTIPRFTRSIMPSLNISEWIPRSRWFISLDRTASGIEPIPGHVTQHTQHESVMVGSVAQWLEHRSLTGELSLIYA